VCASRVGDSRQADTDKLMLQQDSMDHAPHTLPAPSMVGGGATAVSTSKCLTVCLLYIAVPPGHHRLAQDPQLVLVLVLVRPVLGVGVCVSRGGQYHHHHHHQPVEVLRGRFGPLRIPSKDPLGPRRTM